ncbi:LysR family transcriptional regulator [Paraburkholderia sp. SOS3]|jgi:DNA-binding transcriptional LysR family regulator|uniref:LysR family transcriptional regulator n=1 Tax=Paraburkholderia sp. SOS3 TaxID=1926494 RepID=UPI0009477119|nr:LysR family transcriptional regulator [Paraburkholderia sp. SOS3]APR38308.1 hypothetical protein BTO02_22650 [Paraburkholderia sp. SOS3]
MQDVNDYFYFAKVVQHRGFSSAARALRVTKSALSKRVARLEERLQARLIERSSRGFRVTAVGLEVYEQCEAIVAGVEGADAIARKANAAPRGAVRFACPPGMVFAAVSSIVPDFLEAYPDIQLSMVVSNRSVDLIGDGFDVALRIRDKLDSDANYVVKRIGLSRRVLVASPRYAEKTTMPASAADLARCSILSLGEDIRSEKWNLVCGTKEEIIEVSPKLATSEFSVLLNSAIAGAGIALLPLAICNNALADGRLIRVLPEWHSHDSIVHLVFTTRRGLLPATRAFMDYLAARLAPLFKESVQEVFRQ